MFSSVCFSFQKQQFLASVDEGKCRKLSVFLLSLIEYWLLSRYYAETSHPLILWLKCQVRFFAFRPSRLPKTTIKWSQLMRVGFFELWPAYVAKQYLNWLQASPEFVHNWSKNNNSISLIKMFTFVLNGSHKATQTAWRQQKKTIDDFQSLFSRYWPTEKQDKRAKIERKSTNWKFFGFVRCRKLKNRSGCEWSRWEIDEACWWEFFRSWVEAWKSQKGFLRITSISMVFFNFLLWMFKVIFFAVNLTLLIFPACVNTRPHHIAIPTNRTSKSTSKWGQSPAPHRLRLSQQKTPRSE